MKEGNGLYSNPFKGSLHTSVQVMEHSTVVPKRQLGAAALKKEGRHIDNRLDGG